MLQVVIGPNVSSVYEAIKGYHNISDDHKEIIIEKQKFLDVIFNTVSGSFTLLIPILCGSGLIKALVTILLQL
ncbi:PTS beta-glucoside transporter subunit EIIBCA, partial [Enterococcus faecium]|nr:PTS beta-glucoside transporter subunit EIIBCA [Enterococcus faecium]